MCVVIHFELKCELSCVSLLLMLLVGLQEGHAACKKRVVGCWCGYLLERGADLHMAPLMPLPVTVPCFSKIQKGVPFWYRLTWVVVEKGR